MNSVRNTGRRTIGLGLRWASSKSKDAKSKCSSGKDQQEKTPKRCTLIHGDGVGCEIIQSVMDVFAAAQVPIKWDIFPEHTDAEGEQVLPELLESLCRNRVALKGPIYDRKWHKQLIKKFDLFAYVAVCRNIVGHESPYGKLDCVIIRDQAEGDYSGIEHRIIPGVMQTIKICTTAGANRIARYVFRYAQEMQRKKITCAHKSNIMRMTDGNFLEAMRREAQKHLEKRIFEERYMDTAALNLIMYPQSNDVLVSSSMYGDMLTVIASSIVGGRSLTPGYGVSSRGFIFDSMIRPNKKIAGQDLANPTGLLLSAVLMLRELKLERYADKIECGIHTLYKETKCRTQDLGGTAKCTEFTKAVCECMPKE